MDVCAGLLLLVGFGLVVYGLVGRTTEIAPRCAFCGFDRSMLSARRLP